MPEEKPRARPKIVGWSMKEDVAAWVRGSASTHATFETAMLHSLPTFVLRSYSTGDMALAVENVKIWPDECGEG